MKQFLGYILIFVTMVGLIIAARTANSYKEHVVQDFKQTPVVKITPTYPNDVFAVDEFGNIIENGKDQR